MTIKLINADWTKVADTDWRFDHLITDIPYGSLFLVTELRRLVPGNIITFEKPNVSFDVKPSQIYYWIKPSLPKNTVKRLADPVECIYVWQNGCYNGPKVSKMQNGNYCTVRYDLVEGQQFSPFQKPLSLMLWLLELHTKPGDKILDICAGTGTTLLAARMLGRDAVGIEKDPKTFEIAKRRLEL